MAGIIVRANDFSVNLEKREVTHVSGTVVVFGTYANEDVWKATTSVKLRNPDLFDGDIDELSRVAKQVAISAGMRHK